MDGSAQPSKKEAKQWIAKKADLSRNLRYGGPLLRSDKRRSLTAAELEAKQVLAASGQLRELSQQEPESKQHLLSRLWSAEELESLQEKLTRRAELMPCQVQGRRRLLPRR